MNKMRSVTRIFRFDTGPPYTPPPPLLPSHAAGPARQRGDALNIGRGDPTFVRTMSAPTNSPFFSLLSDRAVLSVSGDDRYALLQGIVSNDVDGARGRGAVYAALLTPQGKYLHDFFVVDGGEALWIDCEAARADDLLRRLSRYRLRAKVALASEPGLSVVGVWGAASSLPPTGGTALAGGGTLFRDPRLPQAGWRAVMAKDAVDAFVAGHGLSPGDYDAHRLALGLPDGSRDMDLEKTILLEAGFHELHGVDWQKGCYMGQELTARTYYRGLIKKRIVPVTIDGPAPPHGAAISRDGKEVGEMRSAAGGRGLALLRIDEAGLAGASPPRLEAAEATLTPRIPDWMVLKPSAKATDAAE